MRKLKDSECASSFVEAMVGWTVDGDVKSAHMNTHLKAVLGPRGLPSVRDLHEACDGRATGRGVERLEALRDYLDAVTAGLEFIIDGAQRKGGEMREVANG